jgi:hypothetical protein
MGNGATANQDAISPRNLNRSAYGEPRQQRSCFCRLFLEKTWRSRPSGFSDSIPTHTRRAPQHIFDTDMGRERPRRSAPEPGAQRVGGVAHAPSCCDTCAGALTGRHKPPPVLAPPAPASTSARSMDCGVPVTCVALELHASREIAATARGGPTAPWRCVPLLGPSDRGYSNGLTMRTPSRSPNPGRSSE